jgi:hypothetical protein
MSGRMKFGNGFARADVTDVTDVRKNEERAIMKEPIPKSQYFGYAIVLPSPNNQVAITNNQFPITNEKCPKPMNLKQSKLNCY